MENIIGFIAVIAILAILSVLWNYYMNREAGKILSIEDTYSFSTAYVRESALKIKSEDLKAVDILGDGNSEVKFSSAVENIIISDMSRIKIDDENRV
ncbi:MAG: hypothetical protein NC240_04255 [Clostridium sp.]|nr:hypothetical protein [Clostridium sp.]